MESRITTDVGTRAARDRTVTETVIAAVAEANGIEPTDLDPLFDVIDPDALNDIYRTKWAQSPRSLTVEFQYEGCTVVVRAKKVTVSKSTGVTERSIAVDQTDKDDDSRR
ncbi:HalOD1 output domain-containing protein [Halogeometricum pallidum]|nr:HalOD1 output domain-containing protein [Halogeometricum pallidum]